MVEENHLKELKKEKMCYKITWINYEEEDFRGVELTMDEYEDFMCILGVVYRFIEHLNSHTIICKIQSKDNNLV